MRILRVVAVASGVVALAAAAGAGALELQASGSPDPATVSRHRDALWMGHSWVDGRRTAADARRLAGSLRDTGVRDLYLHVGPLATGGTLDPALRPVARPLVR